MSNNGFKYFAFISYNSLDTKWGKRLQRKLESYRLPSTLCSERGWDRNPIKPVFLAASDIQPGGLSVELQHRLQASRNLIVICSPNSAKSEWVGREIEYFNSLGRANNIHFFIVDGVPHSKNPDTECFNPIVEKLGFPEILGANINEKVFRWPWLNRERAYIQLITKLLGVEFDSIWNRHKRLLIQRIIWYIVSLITIIAALIGVWISTQPFSTNLTLTEISEHNVNLPPLKDAVVTITIADETKTATISSLDQSIQFVNLPHSQLGKPANISIKCKGWVDVDTTVVLDKELSIGMSRDNSVYGNVYFRIVRFNNGIEEFVPDVNVTIAGINTVSDKNGVVKLSIPLNSQQTIYKIKCSAPLVSDSIFMPSSQSDVLIISE